MYDESLSPIMLHLFSGGAIAGKNGKIIIGYDSFHYICPYHLKR